ncbi:MAG TPA: condensation domain-containing protein, partial [Rhodoferax sp.]|nr:condensation domain-containing protein [Rhodoferax sp.]
MMDLLLANGHGEDVEDIYALSPLQEGMLFHVLREPDAGMYFQQAAFTMTGLAIPAFERAWQRLVDRHPILRTSFHWEGREKPVQVVHRNLVMKVERLDWRAFPPAEQEAHLTEFLREDRQRGLPLDQAPVQRITLIQIADNAHHYVWSHHHILLDGWSGPLLFKELFGFYEAFRRGGDLNLPKPRPFADYIAWLGRQDMEKAEAFWRDCLKGLSAPTPLPEDRSGEPRHLRGDRFEQRHVQLSETVTTALNGLVRRQQITLNTLVQGAWALLLSQYCDLDDVCFGTLVSGRTPELDGIEHMVGLFINTLPVRVRVPQDAALIPWLKGIHAQQSEMRQYEYSPLVQVQGWSEIKRSLPMFESLVVFENYPGGKDPSQAGRGQSGSKFKRTRSPKERTNYPLAILAGPGKELLLRATFDRTRFDPDAIGRILEHLAVICNAIAADPDRHLGDLGILSPAERQRVLVDWNETRVDFGGPECA